MLSKFSIIFITLAFSHLSWARYRPNELESEDLEALKAVKSYQNEKKRSETPVPTTPPKNPFVIPRCKSDDTMCIQQQQINQQFREELASIVTESIGEVLTKVMNSNITSNLMKAMGSMDGTGGRDAETQVMLSLVSNVISFVSGRAINSMSHFVQGSISKLLWDLVHQMTRAAAAREARAKAMGRNHSAAFAQELINVGRRPVARRANNNNNRESENRGQQKVVNRRSYRRYQQEVEENTPVYYSQQ